MTDKFSLNSEGMEASGFLNNLRQFPYAIGALAIFAVAVVFIAYLCRKSNSSVQTVNGSTVGQEARILQENNQAFFNGSSDQKIENTKLVRKAELTQRR